MVQSLEEDVFENYRGHDESDENLETIFDPIFDLLKEQSEELVVCIQLIMTKQWRIKVRDLFA